VKLYYIEFDLKKGGGPQKVGHIQLALDKADPKRNRFTLDVWPMKSASRSGIEPSTSSYSFMYPAAANPARS
jgi:hypothetical protein